MLFVEFFYMEFTLGDVLFMLFIYFIYILFIFPPIVAIIGIVFQWPRIYWVILLKPFRYCNRQILRQIHHFEYNYVSGYFLEVYISLFMPWLWIEYAIKVMTGTFIRIHLWDYLIDNCWDSNYPDQVKFVPVNLWHSNSYFRYLESNNLLKLVLEIERVDDVFQLDSTDYHVYDRFIELMPSVTLLQFSKLSKNTHFKCLEIRGIEFDCFYYNPSKEFTSEIEENNQTNVSTNGRLVGISLEGDLDKLVNCMGSLRAEGWCTAVHFIPNYKRLILEFKNSNFGRYYKASLEHYLHDRLESIAFFICCSFIDDTKHVNLTDLIECLDLCNKVPKICISFGDVNRLVIEPVFTGHSLLAGEPTADQIIKAIETWASTIPGLKFFKLIYHFGYPQGFFLHNGKLKVMKHVIMRNWFLADYSEATYCNFTAPHDRFYECVFMPYNLTAENRSIYWYFDHIF